MSVANDGSGTPNVHFTAATSASLTTFTVGTGTDRVLLAMAAFVPTVTSVTATWNSTAMTEILSFDDTFVLHKIFLLIAPASGNNTLALAWTGSSAGGLGAIAFSGADQVTGYVSADNTTTAAVANEVTVTIPSSTDGATVALTGNVFANYNAPTQTLIYQDNGGTLNSSATYALGGASNAHYFHTGGVAVGACGVHIAVAGAAAFDFTFINPWMISA